MEKSSERLMCYDGELRRKSEKQMTERRVAPGEKEDKMEINRDLRLRRKKDVIRELRTANIR